MTELELYKFISDNSVEWHRHENDGEDDVIMMPHTWDIQEFQDMVKGGASDDAGIVCHMRENYFCFWMRDICNYYGIEMNNVFKGNNYDD